MNYINQKNGKIELVKDIEYVCVLHAWRSEEFSKYKVTHLFHLSIHLLDDVRFFWK
jgi:hypothetical protein